MAQAVVVVEGGVDSGAMITARHAVAQQRVVYAVPGSVFAPGSRGPHHLLAEGAAVLRDPEEVLDRLGLVRAVPLGGTPQPSLGEDEARVLEVLGDTPVYIDGIIDQAGLGAGWVAAVLATLEMRGLVWQRPGKRFARRSGFDPAGAQQHAGGDS